MFYEGTLQNGVTEGERVMDQVSYMMACDPCFANGRARGVGASATADGWIVSAGMCPFQAVAVHTET